MSTDESNNANDGQSRLTVGIERNRRVQERYDALRYEGKHGFYETLFEIVREEVEQEIEACAKEAERGEWKLTKTGKAIASAIRRRSNVRVERKPIGLRDMDGREIFTGDIVEFYFCANKGHSKEPNAEYTRMRDLVVERDGDFYFVCNFGSSFAWRHADYCRVIGDNPELVDT